nr:unnamed protein product [Callosobruchus chinensis]
MDVEHVVGDTDRGNRKRQRNATSRQRKKELRYCDPDSNLEVFEVSCKHGKNGKLACQYMYFT